MEAVAKLRNSKGSPRKARLVIDLIRGKDVDDALNIIRFTQKRAAVKIEKLVASAINNWTQKNEGLRPEDSELYIKAAFVDGASVMKRFQPAPHGRAHRIRKRLSHITVVVDSRLPMEVLEMQDVEEPEVIDENE